MNKKTLDTNNTLNQLQKNITLAIEEAGHNGISIITYFHALHPYGVKRGASHPIFIDVDKEYFPFNRTTESHFDNRYRVNADLRYLSLGTELLNNEGDLLLRVPTKVLSDSIESLKREADNEHLPKQIHQNLNSTLTKLQAKISRSNPVEELYNYGEWEGYDHDRSSKNSRQEMLTEKIPLAVLKAAIDSYMDLAKHQISKYGIDGCFEARITYFKGKLERLQFDVPIRYFPFSMLTEIGGFTGIHGFDTLTLASDLIGSVVFSRLPFSKRRMLLNEEIPQNLREGIFEYVDALTPESSKTGDDKRSKANKKLLYELKIRI